MDFIMIEFFEKGTRRFECEWYPAPFVPPRELTIQSSGICFADNGKITLVNDGRGWALPGGYPENDETLEQALIREIDEEACALVLDYEYIGSLKNIELSPVPEGRSPLFYQARYWTRVKNLNFDPQFEMTERIEIEPGRFVPLIRWKTKGIAQLILDAAISVELQKSAMKGGGVV